jgi:hypothetical protein
MRHSERRAKRSGTREEALQFLVEAVKDRSEVRAVAVIDGDDRILAGTGMPHELSGLARIAGRVAQGEPCAELDDVTHETDLLTCGFAASGKTMYLAALGTRVNKMPEAVRAVRRILATTDDAAL